MNSKVEYKQGDVARVEVVRGYLVDHKLIDFFVPLPSWSLGARAVSEKFPQGAKFACFGPVSMKSTPITALEEQNSIKFYIQLNSEVTQSGK